MRVFLSTVLLLALACKTDSSSTAQPPAAGQSPAPAAAPAAPAAAPSSSAAASSLQPTQIAPRTLAPLPGGRAGLGPFSLQIPADWKEKPTVGGMRAAEFQPPESGGQAEVIVYYFGESGAGSVQANLDRWLGQFTQPDGKPSKDVAKVEQATFAGQQASVLSVTGRYVARAMPGATEAVDKPDQSLIAAIVPSPKGPYYFRMIGDRAAVAAQEPKFRELLASLKLQ